MELISIIMPAYNADKYIEKTIKSIIMQTYTNWELVIVNDGSTDDTDNICKKYAKDDIRIKYHYKENEGVSIARNFGINKAQGKYCMFIDSDDTMNPNMIEKMYSKIIQNNCDIVRCNYYINTCIDSNEMLEEGLYSKSNIKNTLIDMILQEKMKCFVWLLLIKKDKIKKFKENLHIYEDFCFYLENLLSISSMYIMNEKLYYYNKENENSLSKKNIEKNINNMISAEKSIIEILNQYNLDTKENKKKISTRVYTNIVNYTFLYQYNYGIKKSIKLYKKIEKNIEYIKEFYDSRYVSKKELIINYFMKKHFYIGFWFLCIIKNKKRRFNDEKKS